MRSTIWLALFTLLAQAPAQPPQSPQPPQPSVTFRVEVNYVEIDANVVDAQGNFVRNLTRDDFQIIEDLLKRQLAAAQALAALLLLLKKEQLNQEQITDRLLHSLL